MAKASQKSDSKLQDVTKSTKPAEPADGIHHWLRRMRYCSTAFGLMYLGLVLLLTIPIIQSHTLYLNAVRLPWFANFDRAEDYGMAPGKTINLHLNTPDNQTIGAWFIFSEQHYVSQSFPPPASPSLDSIQAAVKSHPTILFFHGNAATRAFHVRIAHYQAYTARLNVNVLAIDYRGYGDSTGSPTEDGLAIDARTAWDWLVDHGADGDDILIVGHSLGTGVSARLAGQLSEEGVKYRGVVLMSPFSSLETLLNTYSVLGLFPVMRPLTAVPGLPKLIGKALVHKFDTLAAFHRISGHTLIAHAENDLDIPHSHSDTLFNSLLEPLLPKLQAPPQDALQWKEEDWKIYQEVREKRKEKREVLVRTTGIENFGVLQDSVVGARKISLLKTQAGGHDRLGIQEGVQDVIRKMFDL